jgi:tetratricopeptide (TPR) repeat protein
MISRALAVSTLCVFCLVALHSCPAESTVIPERIYSKRTRMLSDERYKELRDQWKAYTESRPKDAMGWTELAKAARYSGEPCETYLGYAKKAVQLDPEYADARTVLGGNIWCMYCPKESEDPSAAIRELEKALELDPSSGDPRYSLWVMKLSQGKRDEATAQVRALLQDGHIPEPLVDFAYNLLVGLEQDAILLTNGDNDTYPLLALQAARGFRQDVAVVNLSLLNTVWYRKEMRGGPLAVPVPLLDDDAPGPRAGEAVNGLVAAIRETGWKRPLYVSCTVYRQALPLANRLSLEGLAYRVLQEEGKEDAIDTDRLGENLNRVYRLESATSLGFDWNHFTALPPLLKNYAALEARLAGALSEKGDPAAAGGCMARALRLCEFHGMKDFGRSLADHWKAIDPASPEPAKWSARFAE